MDTQMDTHSGSMAFSRVIFLVLERALDPPRVMHSDHVELQQAAALSRVRVENRMIPSDVALGGRGRPRASAARRLPDSD